MSVKVCLMFMSGETAVKPFSFSCVYKKLKGLSLACYSWLFW
jgi:hypothetical protein